MSEEHGERQPTVEPHPIDSEQKPQWVKPVIRASGTFDMQALACPPPQQSAGFPPCLGGVS